MWQHIPGIVANVAGPLLNYHAQKEANQINKDNAQRNIEKQEEFAKHGLRWKVQDALAAGISPLAALGASGAAFAPVHVGAEANTALGDGLQSMGQNISRAVAATSTQEEKTLSTLRLQSLQLDLEGKALDNQIRASQLRQLNTGPAFPGSDNFLPGQGDSGIKINPSERTAHQLGRPAQDAGWITDRAFSRTDTGLTPVPSKDVTDRIEDKVIPEAMWAFRNNLLPTLEYLFNGGTARSGAPSPSQLPDPKRQEWRWNPYKQEWYPHTWDRRR